MGDAKKPGWGAFLPRFNIPETFGTALSYEGQLHWFLKNWDDVAEYANDLEQPTIDIGRTDFPDVSNDVRQAEIVNVGTDINAKLDITLPIIRPRLADPLEWDASTSYDLMTIVTDGDGNSYTARVDVPAGTPLTNAEYWAMTGSYDASIIGAYDRMTDIEQTYGRVYSTLSDMVADTDLVPGMTCRVLGNYSAGVGVEGWYSVVAESGDDTIECANGKHARVIYRRDWYDWVMANLGVKYSHRGYGYNNRNIGENTMGAYKMALSAGFAGLEVDIQYDKDRRIVCYHGTTLDDLTDHTGTMQEYAYSDIKVKSAATGLYTESPALLSDVLRLAKNNNACLNIEFKEMQDGTYVNASEVVELANYYGVDKVIYNHPDPRALDGLDVVKMVSTWSASTPTVEQLEEYVRQYGNAVFYLGGSAVNATLVNECAARRIPIATWDFGYNCRIFTGDSAPRPQTNLAAYDSGWLDLPLRDGITTNTGNYKALMRRVGNTCFIRGAVAGFTQPPSSSSTRTQIGVLPPTFRPSYNMRLPVVLDLTTECYPAMLLIDTTGVITLFAVDPRVVSSPTLLTSHGIFIDCSFSCPN